MNFPIGLKYKFHLIKQFTHIKKFD